MLVRIINVIIICSFAFASNWVPMTSQSEAEAKVFMLDSDIETTVLNFSVEGFNLVKIEVEGETAHYIDVEEGTPIMSKGDPHLEKLVQSIIIPDFFLVGQLPNRRGCQDFS